MTSMEAHANTATSYDSKLNLTLFSGQVESETHPSLVTTTTTTYTRPHDHLGLWSHTWFPQRLLCSAAAGHGCSPTLLCACV